MATFEFKLPDIGEGVVEGEIVKWLVKEGDAVAEDQPLVFDTLSPYGCFIGSAAVVVLSDKDSAAAAARNVMKFFADESCGQCTPCRVGTQKALELMTEPRWDQPLLQELSQAMVDASICGLGQAAPNPVLSVLKYFPREVE